MSEREDGAVEFGTSGSASHTDFDEIEQLNTAPTVPDLAGITLDGEEVPEDLRGKSAKDVLAQLENTRKALSISENARLALQNSQEALQHARQAPAAPSAPPPEPELTEEQERELWDRDPYAFQKLQQERLERKVLTSVGQRLQPLVGNSAEMAIRDARQRFPDEFAAIGPDIDVLISSLPDKNGLAVPGAMDELINYARGKYVQKYIEYLQSKPTGGLQGARESARRETPTSFAPSQAAPRSKGAQQLDDVQKAVAEALNISYEDYAKNIIPSHRGR